MYDHEKSDSCAAKVDRCQRIDVVRLVPGRYFSQLLIMKEGLSHYGEVQET
jgi:hypothetical protein